VFSSTRAIAQDCQTGCGGPPYSVSVTPDNGSTPSRPNQSGGWSATFTVRNTGTASDVYDITCNGAAGVTCTGTDVASVHVASGGLAVVTAFYDVGAPGTGHLTLDAISPSSDAADGGAYNVPIVVPAGAPIVDATPYNFSKQDYGRCAAACFAATYGQSTVPYFSLDAPRSVALAYNGDRLNPKPFVHVDVTPDLSQGTPTEYRLQVKAGGTWVTFVNGETTLRFAYGTSAKVRLSGQFDWSTYPTGAYPMEIVVAAFVGSNLYFRTISTKLVVVNETNAAVAKGWTLAGVQRAYSQSDGSMLITEGDGSAVYFTYSGATYTAPPGEFSQLVIGIPGGGSGWTRRWPDSTKAVFNTAGLMTEVRDRFNNITTIVYDGSNRVSKVRDPINLPITLTYGANGLSAIQDTMGRVTNVTVDASRRLTAITDPDNVSTTFGYDGSQRLSTITNRRGAATTLGYDAQSGKLATITAPAITFVGTNGADSTGSPVTRLAAWHKVGVPYDSTSTPVAAPTADTVFARMTDPGGHVTRFTVNRWGTPATTTDPLARVTTVTYDASGLPIRVVYPTGVKDTAAYNTSGLPVFTRAAGDSAINIRYAAWAQADSVWGVGHPPGRSFIGLNGRVDSTRAWGTAGAAVTRYTYDARGRVARVTDPEGHLAGWTLYTAGNSNRSQDSLPGGRITTYSYDAYGRSTGVDAPSLAARSTTYDLLNRVLKDSAAGQSPIVYAYDSLYLRTVTDPKGQVYRFAYNALGWTIARTDPANHADSLRYDREGSVRRAKNRRGQAVDFVYDAGHRMTSKSGTNTDAVTWSYPNDTVMVGASPWAVDTQFFSRVGRLDSVRTNLASQIFTQRFRYTTAGALDSVQVVGGGIVFLTRKYVWETNAGKLSAIRLGGGGSTTLTANRDGQLTSTTMPGGTQISRSYTPVHDDALISTSAQFAATVNRYVSFDSLGRIARQVDGDGLTGREFTYNTLGRLVRDAAIAWIDTTPQQEPSNPCTESTFYDPNDPYGHNCTYGQPPEAPPPSGYWFAYAGTNFDYDAVGNRLDQGGSYGTANRLRQFAGCSYVTDSSGDGNVLSRTCGSEVVRFWWTAESRLAALKVAGADSLDFRYDASGRLVRKDLNGSIQSYFLWQGDNLLAELNNNATVNVAEYSYYPGLDNLHAVITGSTPYYAHTDALGNTIALTDSATQNVQRSYVYDAWGQLTSGTDSKPFNNVDRVRFKGALWLGPQVDVAYMRARWYEAKSGRFLSEDPIGLKGGVNPYEYAGSDPVNERDPSGLDGFNPCPTGFELRNAAGTDEDGNETDDWTKYCRRSDAGPRGVAWGDQTVAALWAGWNSTQAWLSGRDGVPGSRWVFGPPEFRTCPLHVARRLEGVRHDPQTGRAIGVVSGFMRVDRIDWLAFSHLPLGHGTYHGNIYLTGSWGYELRATVEGRANCETGGAELIELSVN